MDLVDRYVAAVRRHLPANQQDDIVNELTDDILSQVKDKEEEIGRPLDPAEQETLLKQYGHPYVLATRYRPQQYLIGPALFPFYFPAMKIAMAMAFAVQVIAAFSIGLSQQAPERILAHIMRFPGVALQVAFWVTVSFAVADSFQAKLNIFDKWSPRTLPKVTGAARPPRRVDLVIEVVANVLFIAWWVAIPAYPFLMLGPAAAFLTLSPSWARLFYVALLPAIGSTLLIAATLGRPGWMWMTRLRALVVHVLGLVVVSVALNAGDLVMPANQTPELVRLVHGINQVTTLVLVVIALITMAQVLADVYRLMRPQSRGISTSQKARIE
jgi:hypothetical protein